MDRRALFVGFVIGWGLLTVLWSCTDQGPMPESSPPTLSLSNPTEMIVHWYTTANGDTVMSLYVEPPHPGEVTPTFQLPDIPGMVRHVEFGIGFPPMTVGVSWIETSDSVVVGVMQRYNDEP